MASRKDSSSSSSSNGDPKLSCSYFIPNQKIHPVLHHEYRLGQEPRHRTLPRSELNPTSSQTVRKGDDIEHSTPSTREDTKTRQTEEDNVQDHAGPAISQYDHEYEFVDVSENDVLCGREKVCFHHIGNRRFRLLINSCIERFGMSTSRAQKGVVVQSIVDSISAKGGRFLKQDTSSKRWYVVEEKAREKTNHALRDGLANQLKGLQHFRPAVRQHDAQGEQQVHSWDDDAELMQTAVRLHEASTSALVRNASSGSTVSESALDDYNEIPLARLVFDGDSIKSIGKADENNDMRWLRSQPLTKRHKSLD